MLKTNSKAVKETVRNYIINNYMEVCTDYDLEQSQDFETVKNNIMEVFENEILKYTNKGWFKSYFDAFRYWTSGLCHMINTSYYLNSACDLVGEWLQETESEKSKYTESDAERLIDLLIFRELTKNYKFKYSC